AAGLEKQKTGRVLIDGRVVSEKGVHLPPEQRAVGLMFQDFAL
ncbi:MAG: Fe3+/spermidine/putrescine ABC transporter ATP-binding protein, partial [Gammaproteobacteria bacterium]|nr:Fe3+/spermidine/putrescine ABC transporter ATP-binding protein [Gammaproteobacteria bacterium]